VQDAPCSFYRPGRVLGGRAFRVIRCIPIRAEKGDFLLALYVGQPEG